mgnify:CR=1 FL=1
MSQDKNGGKRSTISQPASEWKPDQNLTNPKNTFLVANWNNLVKVGLAVNRYVTIGGVCLYTILKLVYCKVNNLGGTAKESFVPW